MEPWIWAIQDADEAERRGDAGAALEAMQRRPLDPDGRPFWRPSRVCALQQLALLGPFLPPWAVSRWILAQALQHLDEKDRGPGSRAARAIRSAVDLRGGLEQIEGRDELDKRTQVMEHDWVYRQIHLYELGGLDAFLRYAATPDLVAGADRIADWARAPMGGYVYVGSTGATVRWHACETRDLVETPNIGSAVLLAPGTHVLARMVPIEGGTMLEGPPLAVPSAVARDVAHDSSTWLTVLRNAADQVREGEIVTHDRGWRGLLSDVPLDVLRLVLAYRPDEHRIDLAATDAEDARATLALARAVLAEDDPDDPDEDDGWDGWAHVHAALLDPDVVRALPDVVTSDDVELLRGLLERVAEPARSGVGALIEGLSEAA